MISPSPSWAHSSPPPTPTLTRLLPCQLLQYSAGPLQPQGLCLTFPQPAHLLAHRRGPIPHPISLCPLSPSNNHPVYNSNPPSSCSLLSCSCFSLCHLYPLDTLSVCLLFVYSIYCISSLYQNVSTTGRDLSVLVTAVSSVV